MRSRTFFVHHQLSGTFDVFTHSTAYDSPPSRITNRRLADLHHPMPKERCGQELDMAASFLPGIGAWALIVTGDHREFV
jgi:hypothetical protein